MITELEVGLIWRSETLNGRMQVRQIRRPPNLSCMITGVEIGLIWRSEIFNDGGNDACKTYSATSKSGLYDNGGGGWTDMEVLNFEWMDAIKTNSATSKSVLYDNGGGGRTNMEV